MRKILVHGLSTCVLVTLAFVGPAPAQTGQFRLAVDPRSSLAWWQVNPHLSHLWATTCPQDPSWRPGEGVSSMNWATELLKMRSSKGHAAVKDTVIPLYPRRRVRSICTQAVSGEITAADTVTWRGVRGLITVRADELVTGLDMRDEYARKAILQTSQFPEITFAIDSLGSLQTKGDTLRGNALGTFTTRGFPQPMNAQLKAWHEGGGLRVQARFFMSAHDLPEKYGISKLVLGIGAAGTLWDELHMGVDVVLVPAGR